MATPKKKRSKTKILLRKNGLFLNKYRSNVNIIDCKKCSFKKRKFFMCLNCYKLLKVKRKIKKKVLLK